MNLRPPSPRPRTRHGVLLLGLSLALTGCSRTPVTKRAQLNLIPDGIMLPLGASSYTQMLEGVSKVKGTEDNQVLKRVGERISDVANEPKYDWQYTLIDDDETINAWCLPGGKIAFYTGVLPVLENEAGMAFVMGHEVGHATAHHGSERLSQQLAVLGGLAGLYLYLDDRTQLSDTQQGVILAALGVGAQVGVILPFSRMHEKEADVIGMMYMARAGYPPRQSLRVWDRMSEASGGGKVPAFISTHPSDERRQDNLRDWLDRAKKRFERNKLDEDTLATIWK